MSTILSIETATPVCSCSLSKDGEILINRESYEGQSHASMLGLFVNDIMEYVRENNMKLDAVAVSSGPGSYTGLRIGVSEAKGLSYGLDVPMIAIPTARIMGWMMSSRVDKDVLLCPMIDARRMEVYATIFDNSLNVVRDTAADIIESDSYGELLSKNRIAFFGNGAAKCEGVITHPNALFIEDIHPLASAMATLAEEAFDGKDFVDSAYFEPFYLKEFVATVPRNKIFK